MCRVDLVMVRPRLITSGQMLLRGVEIYLGGVSYRVSRGLDTKKLIFEWSFGKKKVHFSSFFDCMS